MICSFVLLLRHTLRRTSVGKRSAVGLACSVGRADLLCGIVLGLAPLAGCSESSSELNQPQGAENSGAETVRGPAGPVTNSDQVGQSSVATGNPRRSDSVPRGPNLADERRDPLLPLADSGEEGGKAAESEWLAVADAGGGFTGSESGDEPVTVFVAGDSVVSDYPDTESAIDQAGWGQMLPEVLDGNATVINRARGGRTALWFSLEGELDRLLNASQPGDYLLVQFGTNDSHRTAEFTVNGQTRLRYADPDTDFKQHLTELYIEPARQNDVHIVLVTPPPRNSAYCTGGNSLSRWAQAMRELGEEQEIPVADLNTRMVEHLQAICPAPTPENVFFLRPNGSVDGTHFQEEGARQMARFIRDELVQKGVGLVNHFVGARRL